MITRRALLRNQRGWPRLGYTRAIPVRPLPDGLARAVLRRE